MTEVFFYHLEARPLEAVLPSLLERSLERGWRAVVQSASEERIEALDAHLWTYREDSFLPHGRVQERDAEEQPVLLTTGQECPNGARIRFLIDDADLPSDAEAYERLVVLFDGGDTHALALARTRWQEARARGLDVTYWQQDASGRWERKS